MRISEICEGLGVSLETLDKHAAEIARHRREVAQQESDALSIPPDMMTVHAKAELGYDERTEDEFLTLRMCNAARRAKQALERYSKLDIDQKIETERKKRREFDRAFKKAVGG